MRWLAALTAVTALVVLATTGFSTSSRGAEQGPITAPGFQTVRVATFDGGPFCKRVGKPGRTREVCLSRPLKNTPVRVVGGPEGFRVNKRVRTGPDGLLTLPLRWGTYEVRPGQTAGTRKRFLSPGTVRLLEVTPDQVADLIFLYSPPRPESLPSRRSDSAP